MSTSYKTKSELMKLTGVSSDLFDRKARVWFGEVVTDVPEFWLQKFLEFLLK